MAKVVGKEYHHKDVIPEAEMTFSSLMARTIDRFLFSGDSVCVGGCFHQTSTRKHKKPGNPETADIYVCSYDKYLFPDNPMMLSDLKMYNFDEAVRETGLYCISCVEVHFQDNTWVSCYPSVMHTRTVYSIGKKNLQDFNPKWISVWSCYSMCTLLWNTLPSTRKINIQHSPELHLPTPFCTYFLRHKDKRRIKSRVYKSSEGAKRREEQ